MKTLLALFLILEMGGCVWAQEAAQESTKVNTLGSQQEQATKSRSSLADSIFSIKKKIMLDVRNAALHVQLGDLYLQKGELDSAKTAFERALAFDKDCSEAYNGLGLVFYKKGESRIIPFERLKQLLKVDNKSKAVNHFLKALRLNPDYLYARYNLGLTYLAKGDEKSLVSAKEEFNRILKTDFDFKDTYYQLARAYQESGEYSQAIEIFNRVILTNSQDGRAYIRLAEIHFERGENEAACRNYFAGIERLRDEDMLLALFLEIENLLTREEKNEFKNAPIEQKGFLFKKFWKSRDPTPGTVENERLVEHFRRMKFARENFHFTVPPYYDDRGKIYIKYGPPDARYVSPLTNVHARNNESWSYESIHKGLVFDFVENAGYYKQVQDLSEAALPGMGYEQRLGVAAQLYSERSHLSNTYTHLSLTFSQNRLMEFQATRAEALNATPPEIYRHDYRAVFLPILYRWAQFRGTNHKTRLEFYFGVSAKRLGFEKQADNQFHSQLEYSIVAMDTLYNDVIDYKETTQIRLSNPENIKNRQYITQKTVQIPPGRYRLYFQLKNPESNGLGIYRMDVPVTDFEQTKLTISDIQLSTDVHPSGYGDQLQFAKNNLIVIPYPFPSVLKKYPIFIYYEIYNLTYDTNGEIHYQIEYSIKTLKEKRSFLGKTLGSLGRLFGMQKKKSITTIHERKSDSTTAIEYISFNLGNLSAGLTELTVSVKNLSSGEKATSSISFELLD